MNSSAFINGIFGVAISFFPQEIGLAIDAQTQSGTNLLIFKLLGAALFGFGLLNYFGRNAILGGIYGKPILLSNAIFHMIVGGQLLKTVIQEGLHPMVFIPIGVLYAILTIGFFYLNFTSPIPKNNS